MTNDKGILIKNIYYMLSYAFQILKQSNYEKVAAEEFENVPDLFAEILLKGVERQVKQGLYKEYKSKTENLSVLRGKLNIQGTIQNKMQKKQQLFCEFDELTEDNIYNQILKSTIEYLLKDSHVSEKRKSLLKKRIVFFDHVSVIELGNIQWDRLIYHRNNKNYELLLNICYFILDRKLQTTQDGSYEVMGFSDEHMERLYEKFILEYYRKHYSDVLTAKVSKIKWNLTGDNEESMIHFLPNMKTDITLCRGDRTLIIDAKYYGHAMQQNFDKKSLYSSHMYQIFTYVKNKDKDNTGKVSGLLLYAKTEEDIVPDCSFEIGGNRIGAKTLDLNCDFKEIKKQLDQIAGEFIK